MKIVNNINYNKWFYLKKVADNNFIIQSVFCEVDQLDQLSEFEPKSNSRPNAPAVLGLLVLFCFGGLFLCFVI